MTSISVKKQCFFSVIRNKETRISFFFSDDGDKDILFDHQKKHVFSSGFSSMFFVEKKRNNFDSTI